MSQKKIKPLKDGSIHLMFGEQYGNGKGIRINRIAGGLRQALNYKSKYDDALIIILHSINLVPDRAGKLLL